MTTHHGVKADERTAAVAYKANTWGFTFITFALLIDIWYRAAFLGEAAWDLFALLFVSGAISTVYMVRQQVWGQVFGWKRVVEGVFVAALVGAVAAAIHVMTKVM
jgi:hypothetical protein